jgi:hypothetical protein
MTIEKLAKTIREVPMDYMLRDTDWTIADLIGSPMMPVRLYVVDTASIRKRGGEYFIAELANGRFECEWTEGSRSESSLDECIKYIGETMCN